MAKVTSLQGKAVGKVGSVVYSCSGGQMIAREYQPNVANPSTIAQVNQRARLKLASQLAAALAPVIAIPRNGLQTSRNLFIKKNMEQILAQSGNAQIVYENIQLTNGNAGLPAIVATRDTEAGVIVKLAESADASVSRVVYIMYRKTTEDQLQYLGSIVQQVAGDDGLFTATFGNVAGDLVIWAYGMKDVTATAKAKYGDYFVNSGEDIAQLVMSRAIGAGDYQFTQTRGNTLFSGESETTAPEADQVMVYVGASGNGTVAIEGTTASRLAVNKGSSVTVTATAGSDSEFVAWRTRGGSTNLSTSASYTFTANDNADLVAIFEESGPSGEGA